MATAPSGANPDAYGNNVPYLRTISGPWSFFRRMRILAGGQVLEDIDYYNRAHELFHMFRTTDNGMNDSIQATGQYTNHIINNGLHPYIAESTCFNYGGIYPGDSMTVLFKPLSGILNQTKYIPIRYCPIQIELEIVNDILDPIIWPNELNEDSVGDTPTGFFTQRNCSGNWQIHDVQAKCDLCTLDNSLENEYAKHLLEGKSLPIQYDTYVQQFQTVASSDFVTNISRSFTRLKSVFVSMTGVMNYPETTKSWNMFYNPAWGSNQVVKGFFSSKYQMEFQMQVGSRLYPEYPIRSQQEAFYQTTKTLGLASSAWHSIDITPPEWNSCKFVYGLDTEKVTEAGFTGLNTKAGDLIYLKLQQYQVPAEALCNGMYVILHADQILNIRDTGCEVFD